MSAINVTVGKPQQEIFDSKLKMQIQLCLYSFNSKNAYVIVILLDSLTYA